MLQSDGLFAALNWERQTVW